MNHYTLIKAALHTIEPETNWQLSGPVIRSRECNIYRAVSITSGRNIAAKLYAPQTQPAASQQQFSALQKYQTAMTAPEELFRVPQVFPHNRNQRILLMEWIPGWTLHKHLWTPRVPSQKSMLLLKKTGQWLRRFHDVAAIENKTVKYCDYLKGIDKQLALSALKPFQQKTLELFFPRAYATLKQCLDELPPLEAPHARLHGDFTPFNLLIDKTRIIGLDIWATQRKPINVDLARMVTYLTIAYPLFTHHLINSSTGKLHARLTPLFEGYGRDLIDPDSSHFKISLLSEYLRRGVVITSRPLTVKSFLTNRYQLRQIKKHVLSLITALSPFS